MNFLAHLYLSDGSAESMLGSLLPDFVKGKWDVTLPDAVRRGAELHRAVDRFTDAHPRFLACRRRLASMWGRYAGILVDVLWDHVLARDWDRYSPLPLEEFTAHVYSNFARQRDALPEQMRHAVAVMIEQDWLTSYRTVDGIARTLSRMSDRLGHGIRLEPAAEMFRDPHDDASDGVALADAFHAFFPLLVEHARSIDPNAGAFACPPPIPSPTGS